MSESTRDPIRLQAGGGATDFQERLLASAKDDRLSPALMHRLERGLGLPQTGIAPSLVVAKAGMIAWVSAGILAVGLGGGMLGAWIVARPAAPARMASAAVPATASSIAAPTPAAPVAIDDRVEPAATRVAPKRPAARGPHPAAATAVAVTSGRGRDLRAEIGLIDSARDALAARAPARVLEILRYYAARYPEGTFAPEAVALRVEALELSGEHRQAQALARQFVAAHPDSPLAERIERSCNRGRL